MDKSNELSNEFKQAVRDQNTLRVKIMLKDSLLIDKSFNLFEKMKIYALSQGVNLWDNAEFPLKKAERPWTKDVMNYELTALITDFTKEHVEYVKALIEAVYGRNVNNKSVKISQKSEQTRFQNNTEMDSYKVIEIRANKISEIIERTTRDNKNQKIKSPFWKTEDIKSIKNHARKIIEECNKVLGEE